MLGRLVVADNMLPRVALFAQNGVAIVVCEATDALDCGRLLFLDGAVEVWGAVGVSGRGCAVERGGWSWLRFSVRRDRRDVCHNLADTLKERTVGRYCGWLRLYVLWIA